MVLPGLIQFRHCKLEDKELAERVAKHLEQMYKPPVSIPPRNIPARPDEDFDLLLAELIVRFCESKNIEL